MSETMKYSELKEQANYCDRAQEAKTAHCEEHFDQLLEGYKATRELLMSYGVSSAVLKVMDKTLKAAQEVTV